VAPASFCRFDLRTTDAEGARAFYAKLLGHDRAMVWPLHEQALARGARPHWVGQLAVDDVEAAADAFVARGATRLGPPRPLPSGGHAVNLRDPGGAVVAVGPHSRGDEPHELDVAWPMLHTSDVERARTDYRELFGLELGERVAPTRPGIHPHWLFFFDVDELEAKIAVIRGAGSVTLEPMVLPSGERICVADDPQGAAFGLRERVK
jgi:hypothetical protein